jgi:amino acid efflux transporter
MNKANKLQREIGIIPLIVYYFSTVVGAGIFLAPVLAARTAGPASMISWALVLFIAYPFAMIFAQISQKYQVSGSIQKFVEDSTSQKFGKSIAIYLVLTSMVGTCLLGFLSARYTLEIFDISNNELTYPVAIMLLAISCLFNLINIGFSSRVQTVSLIILVAFIEFVVLTSIPHFKIDNFTPFAPHGYSAIFVAVIYCFYSIVGWENVDAIAEEVKNPARTYKKAIRLALSIIGVFYLSLVITVILAMTPEQIQNKSTILTVLLTQSFGIEFGRAGSVLAVVLLFLGANVWIMGTSRLIFALARDRVIPSFLAQISHKTGIPAYAILIQLLIYASISMLMLFFDANEDYIADIASLNYLILYATVFFCGVKNFHSKRLKILSATALTITSIFLLNNANDRLGVALVIALVCFLYIFIFKRSGMISYKLKR